MRPMDQQGLAAVRTLMRLGFVPPALRTDPRASTPAVMTTGPITWHGEVMCARPTPEVPELNPSGEPADSEWPNMPTAYLSMLRLADLTKDAGIRVCGDCSLDVDPHELTEWLEEHEPLTAWVPYLEVLAERVESRHETDLRWVGEARLALLDLAGDTIEPVAGDDRGVRRVGELANRVEAALEKVPATARELADLQLAAHAWEPRAMNAGATYRRLSRARRAAGRESSTAPAFKQLFASQRGRVPDDLAPVLRALATRCGEGQRLLRVARVSRQPAAGLVDLAAAAADSVVGYARPGQLVLRTSPVAALMLEAFGVPITDLGDADPADTVEVANMAERVYCANAEIYQQSTGRPGALEAARAALLGAKH